MKFSTFSVGVILLGGIMFLADSGQADGGAHHSAAPEHHLPGENSTKGMHMGHMDDVRQYLQDALGESYLTPVPVASPKQLKMGKEVFMDFCAHCHGSDGKGDGPSATGLKSRPSNFTSANHSNYYSDQGRIYIIGNGIPETEMPAWKEEISKEEIQSVHAYIRSLRMASGRAAKH